MKRQRFFLSAILAFLNLTIHATTTHYVDLNCTNPISPYTSWATAATNLQQAAFLASGGDTILVTNGVYQYGSATGDRISIFNNVTVQSVNGPEVTIIKGAWDTTTNGPNALRCAYLSAGSVLSGFTLTNGATTISGMNSGGGAYCASSTAVVTNCVIIGNSAYNSGGGVYSGTLINCSLIGNSTSPTTGGGGGGANNSTLINCLLARNFSGYSSGGAGLSTLINCTVVSNVAAAYAGAGWGSTFKDSIVYYNNSYYNSADDSGGFGNWTNCCIPFTVTSGVNNLTNAPLFANLVAGDYHLNAASPCINAGNNAFITNTTDLDGNPRIVGGTVDLGAYEFQSPIHYVRLAGTNPISPYTNWLTAATNIQDAVDTATSGDVVLVTNGIYATGGRMWYDSGTNRVTLTNAIILQSVNGPAVTLIVGNQVAGTGSVLTNTARCVGMGNNAVLSGFTLTNGEAGSGNYPTGGGVANLVSGVSTVTNCVLIGNLSPTSYYSGGGADRVTLINCKIIGNYAGYGGGASRCALINCTVVSNTASASGGGVYEASALVNCTIVGNSASGSGGGVNNGGSGAMNNCIVYYNTAPSGSNYTGIKMNYCCTVPILDVNSFTNAPLFQNMAAGDFYLQSNSPCINAGNNAYVTSATDLDGNPRIVGGTVDIGAYECQSPALLAYYTWLQNYNLPTSASAIYADSDGDGMNNYQEWIAGTDPTNPLSLLEMLNPTSTNNPTGLVVSWESVSNITYFLQSSTNLATQPAFSTIQSNIIGQIGTTSYTDTNAIGSGPFFYRVGVQQ